jgi:hypothetical protein
VAVLSQFRLRVEIHLHLVALQIDDPVFLNAGAGVELTLHRAVIGEGGIGYLDEKEDVFGEGLAFTVTVCFRIVN